jgi:hypothetical protein
MLAGRTGMPFGALRVDRDAWELAKNALGEDSTISEIAIRAESIKEALKAQRSGNFKAKGAQN